MRYRLCCEPMDGVETILFVSPESRSNHKVWCLEYDYSVTIDQLMAMKGEITCVLPEQIA